MVILHGGDCDNADDNDDDDDDKVGVCDDGKCDFNTFIYTVSTSHAINFFSYRLYVQYTSYTRVYYIIIIASYRFAVYTVIIILLYFPAVRAYCNTMGGGEALW